MCIYLRFNGLLSEQEVAGVGPNAVSRTPFDSISTSNSKMITSQHVSASVRVNNIDLPHFQADHDEATRTVTCWIPSEAGKPYAVRWKVEKDLGREAQLAGRIYLDGSSEMQNGTYCDMAKADGVSIDASRVSLTGERPFVFSEVHLTGSSLSSITFSSQCEYDLNAS